MPNHLRCVFVAVVSSRKWAIPHKHTSQVKMVTLECSTHKITHTLTTHTLTLCRRHPPVHSWEQCSVRAPAISKWLVCMWSEHVNSWAQNSQHWWVFLFTLQINTKCLTTMRLSVLILNTKVEVHAQRACTWAGEQVYFSCVSCEEGKELSCRAWLSHNRAL